MKKILIILITIISFVLSCNNNTTSPISENIDNITYYDPSAAETKSYYITRIKLDGSRRQEKAPFLKLAESDNAILYVEKGYDVSRESLQLFMSGFEKNYVQMKDIYGEPSDIDGNGKIILLMSDFYAGEDIKDMSGLTLGFFKIEDLTALGKGGEYLYINITSINNPEQVLGVIMHECQHLINENVNTLQKGKSMDLWLNESLSESTSHLFSQSLVNRRKEIFNKYPYYSFYSWRLTDLLSNGIQGGNAVIISYASSSMFMQWLKSKDPDIFKKIAHSDASLKAEQRVIESVKHLNIGSDMQTIMLNYIKAAYNGEIDGIKAKVIDPSSAITSSGKLPLVPGGMIIYDKGNGDGYFPTDKIHTETISGNINIAINKLFETSDVGGYIDPANIAEVTLPTINARANNSMQYQKFDLNFEGDHFIDEILD